MQKVAKSVTIIRFENQQYDHKIISKILLIKIKVDINQHFAAPYFSIP